MKYSASLILFLFVPRVLAAVGVAPSAAQSNGRALQSEDRVTAAVRNYLEGPPPPIFGPTWYRLAFVDLTGHGKRQAIVYVSGDFWCGSGGCRMLVLTEKDSSYEVISIIPAVKLPIRVVEKKSHGWHDLSVFIQGGGILEGYFEAVKFNGKTYSKDDSERVERRSAHKIKGKVIVSLNDRELPLYPLSPWIRTVGRTAALDSEPDRSDGRAPTPGEVTRVLATKLADYFHDRPGTRSSSGH